MEGKGFNFNIFGIAIVDGLGRFFDFHIDCPSVKVVQFPLDAFRYIFSLSAHSKLSLTLKN